MFSPRCLGAKTAAERAKMNEHAVKYYNAGAACFENFSFHCYFGAIIKALLWRARAFIVYQSVRRDEMIKIYIRHTL